MIWLMVWLKLLCEAIVCIEVVHLAGLYDVDAAGADYILPVMNFTE